MEQAVKTEQGRASFTKKIGQTTFRVNVYFAENTTATFEDKLLHLMENDIAKRKVSTPDAEEQKHTNHYFYG
ncbi:MAG: transposon-encoded TnpW family protein [Lachnospiraceae bacterium]